MIREPKVRTCFWFDHHGEEAAGFYVSLLPDSRIDHVARMGDGGPALIVAFTLAGTPYLALNGGPRYAPTPAASIAVTTEDQEETDRLWAALLADGGAESMCGWLTDRFGISWQIVPAALPRLMMAEDRAAAGRVHAALMGMRKIDIAALERAYAGGAA